jgi:hypothetical protein
MLQPRAARTPLQSKHSVEHDTLPVALLVVPLRTLAAGNGTRAHGARAKADTQYFFLSFFLSHATLLHLTTNLLPGKARGPDD